MHPSERQKRHVNIFRDGDAYGHQFYRQTVKIDRVHHNIYRTIAERREPPSPTSSHRRSHQYWKPLSKGVSLSTTPRGTASHRPPPLPREATIRRSRIEVLFRLYHPWSLLLFWYGQRSEKPLPRPLLRGASVLTSGPSEQAHYHGGARVCVTRGRGVMAGLQLHIFKCQCFAKIESSSSKNSPNT